MGTEMRPGQSLKERIHSETQCVHYHTLIKSHEICGHLFLDGHWKGSSASDSPLYWHSHRAVGNNTAAWFLSQSVDPSWRCSAGEKKKTYIIHYACVFIISPNAVVFKEKNKQLKVTQRP